MFRFSRRTAISLGAGTVLLTGALTVPAHLRSLSFVARAANLEEGPAGSLAEWASEPLIEQPLVIPTRHGPLRARLYRPQAGSSERTVLLTTGVHAEGIDEPRLESLARDLASGGLAVVTPELPDLMAYRITARLPDLLEDAAVWTAAQPELALDGKVGLIGISFSGGLSIVAAGRPALQDKVAFVLSLGGHGDLARVLRFLCTGTEPDGTKRAPHDYGLAVVLLNLADRVVPADQVRPLQEGIRVFLRASHLALHDAKRAEETFARARQLESELPPPAGLLMKHVNDRNVAALGSVLLPHIDSFASAAALSPERSAPPSAPTWLLHGAGDNVVPAVESTLLARHLRESVEDVHQLSTPLISHAELDRAADALDVLELVRFWAGPLDE